MATIIENIRYKGVGENDIATIRADLSVETASDLPETDGVTGFVLLDGCICLIRQTGDFYILDNGTWYNADGSGAAGD